MPKGKKDVVPEPSTGDIGEPTEVPQTPSPEGNLDVEPSGGEDIPIIDEDGVPYKNRFECSLESCSAEI